MSQRYADKKPASPLRKPELYRITLEDSIPTEEFDEIATMELLAVDIGQLPTQIGLRAIFAPPRPTAPLNTVVPTAPLPDTPLPSEVALEDYPTLVLPALPVTEDHVVSEPEQAAPESRSYLSLALNMVKSSGIYALGAFVSPLVSLILTPFLTQHLSSTTYGGLAVLYTFMGLTAIVTQLGLAPAFFRAYNSDFESPRDRLGVLTASLFLLLLATLPMTAAMITGAPLIAEFLFGDKSFTEPVRLAAWITLLNNISMPGTAWLRAEKRAALFSALSIGNLLLGLVANIVLVGVLQMGINGALLANGAGYAFNIVCTLPVMLFLIIRGRGLRLRGDIMQSMLAFGIPTIFSNLASWVLQISDRYLLGHFVSLTQAANYSVAYTLGGVLSPVVLAPFNLAWTPMMYTFAKRKDAAHIFQLVFRWFSVVLLFSTFALSLLSILVFELFFPPSYLAAVPVIPVIAMSTLFIGVWYMFMTGVYIRRKTILELLYMVIAATTNLLLNLFLIPHYGAMGAAVSTLLAYLILITVTLIINEKIYPINFEVGTFALRISFGVALYVGSSFLALTQPPLFGWAISVGALLVYGIFLVLHAGLTVKKIKSIIASVRTKSVAKGAKKYA